jgi:hypothetical protein
LGKVNEIVDKLGKQNRQKLDRDIRQIRHMTKAITKTYSFTKEYSAVMTQIVMAGAIFMAILYAINVYSIVSRTVAMKDIESKAAKLQSSVQDLDAQYISLTNKITPDMARHYGLEESQVTAYIPRTPSLGSAQTLSRGL